MSNFVSAMKAEVLRLARKEVRREIEGLQKSSARYRGEIAELKRRLASMEKQLGRASKGAAPSEDAATEGAPSAQRFNAKGFATQRKRLGLSAAEAGTLLQVSAQTVYGWEAGKSKPRRSQMEAIAAFRKMGKRQVKALLAPKEA